MFKYDYDIEYGRYDTGWFANLHLTEKAHYYKCAAIRYKEGAETLTVDDIHMATTAVEDLFVARTDWFFCFYYFMRWIHG
jgi:hypothetical protein